MLVPVENWEGACVSLESVLTLGEGGIWIL